MTVRPRQHFSLRTKISSLKYLLPFYRLVWSASPSMVLASVFLRMLRSVMPFILLWIPKFIVDAAVAMRGGHLHSSVVIWKLVTLEFILAVLSDCLSKVNSLLESLLGDRLSDQLTVRLMQHAAALDLASFEDPVFYDKLERARRRTGKIGLLSASLNLSQETISLVSLSVGLVVFSPWLVALLLVAVMPSFAGATYYSVLEYAMTFRRIPDLRALDYLKFLGASVQSAKEVKVFGLGGYLTEKYRALAASIYKETESVATRKAVTSSLLGILSTGGYYSAYVVVLRKTISGQISIGTFAFLAAAFSRSRSHIERILTSFNEISEEAMFVKDLFDFFDMKPSIESLPRNIPAPRPIRKGFEFQNVTFCYQGALRPVIRGINFRLNVGEKIALVGENGAGKTTVLKLLLRLYDPTDGRILLDGIDLREYDLDDLRAQCGAIFQDFVHYDATVRENIGLGNLSESFNSHRVREAAREGRALPFIERLPGGIDQMVGKRFEGGVGLSGGEWQKLALARAYMRKEAQMLILDEPSATLDARAEHEIFEQLANLSVGRMAILVSHKFSTVRLADRILVLKDGQINEEGAHHELLAVGGHYSELFDLQAMGYRK